MTPVRRWLLASFSLAIGFGLACQPVNKGWYPVENSTFLISDPKANLDKGDLFVNMFTTRDACKTESEVVAGTDVDLCVPQLDRGSGRVRLGMYLQNKDQTGYRFLNLADDDIRVSHDERPPYHTEIIPHGSQAAGQLYIILIDDTYSVYSTGGMDKIKSALRNKKVKEAFFRKEGSARSAVMLLRFHNEVYPLGGGKLQDAPIIEKPAKYEELIEGNLQAPEKNAWSHTYEALATVHTTLLESPNVQKWLGINQATPKIILLTDGFNNHDKFDACKTNTERLTELLSTLKKVREKGGEQKPSLYAVGMGEPFLPGFKFRIGMKPTVDNLCGEYADQGIDSSVGEGALEKFVDNPSLEFIVDAIGGELSIRDDEEGLAEMFLKASAKRYSWYEIRYDVDPSHLRQGFDTRVIVDGLARGESVISWTGSAWVDPPSGKPSTDDLSVEPSPFRRSFAVVAVILGLMISGMYIGPAIFNARRAVMRRARKS